MSEFSDIENDQISHQIWNRMDGAKGEAARVISIIENKKRVPLENLFSILAEYERITSIEPNVLEIEGPMCVVADMHSQLFDMIKIIKTVETKENCNRFLFLGDYVDRGSYPVETFIYLCCRKIIDPDNFFLIRGNHETESINAIYGLKEKCETEYHSISLYNRMNEVFKCIPVAAVVANSIFCVHAGISPESKSIEDICLIDRFTDIGLEGLLSDITWSDPDETVDIFLRNTSRGTGYQYGDKQVSNFSKKNGIKLIIRAHEVQEQGFKWYFSKKLLSLWSAAKYSECPTSKANYAMIDADANVKLVPIEASDEKGYPLSR